jgi:hypothetical protein
MTVLPPFQSSYYFMQLLLLIEKYAVVLDVANKFKNDPVGLFKYLSHIYSMEHPIFNETAERQLYSPF